MPLRDRVGWERCESGYYCGVETDFSDDVHSLLSFHVSNGGFDYILAPLMNPSYRPSLVEGNSSITQVLPVSGSDLVLAPSQWSSHVVGKISSWIDLDSEDEVLRMDSETTLKQEIAWATHLSLQACLLPTPKGTSCANYARCVNQILQGLTNLQLWLRVPLVKSDGDSGDATLEGLNDSWELWNSFRLLCEHDSKLSVALDVMSTLPSESSIRRWMGESVRAVIVSTDSFLTNARGYPCLSRRHQKLVTGFFDHAVQVVISGKPVHNVSKALDSKSESTQKNHLRSYLDFLAFLFKKMEPLPEQERLELSYREFLQAPLQPLMDNLEAQIYETFERDSIKYIQCQRAIAKALVDRVSDDKASELTTVLMVVGAGRGPLVRASLQATEETDRKLKVYAVEKNPNAVVTLHNLVKMEGWEDIVTIISCDMRFWNAPEQADILVSELLDSSGDNELSPECLDRAQRFLKPDGISIPSSYTSLIQPVKALKLYNDVKARKDLAHFETAHVVNMHSVARHTFPRRMGFFTRMLFKRKKRKRNIPDEAVLEEDPCRDILHPPGSNNKYRTLVLDNGMSVLLVSSDAIEDVAAAVAVKCGSFADPPEMQGLAHLLEHVLLLGSRTYPVPNQFKDFVHKHCGEVHAVTELDHSVFSMRVDWEYIVDALKMFADIFSHPVMDIELIEKELTTIDSEFDLHKFKDIVRLEQLMCHTALETNVFHRFTWGNKDSLSQCDLKSLRSGLKKLFAEYYIASNMKLVISFPKAKLDFDDVEDLVKKYFVNLNNTKLKEGIGSFPKYSSTKEIWKTDRCYVLESLEDAQTISLSWVLPPCQYNSSRPEKLILFLLSQENEGSLCFLLKSKGWVLNFKCSVGSEASFDSDGVNWSYNSTVACQLFVIKSDLTNTGWEKRYEMVGFVFQYLNLLRVQHPSKELIDQYKTSLKMKYYGLEYDMGNPCFFGQALAANMLKEPTIRALIMDYVYDFGTHEDMQEVLKKLTPKNMRVDFSSKSFTRSHSVFETVPYFNAKFRVEEFPSGFVDTWENIDVSGDPSLYLPALNKFFPSRFFEDIALCNERDSKVKASNFVKCFDGSSAKLFLSRDATSLLAEASFNLYIEVGSGIKAHMKAFIFMEMLKEDLSVIFLNGEYAHINTSLSFEDNNMVKLRFHGFHEKLNDFITEIWKMIKSYIPREKCFKDIMEKMQREFISRDLSKQANQMLSARMKDGIDLDAKFEALESVTFEDIEHLTIFSKIRIVGVCSGNFSKKESVELLKVFDATGDFVIPNEPERKIELTPGIPLQINAKPKTESETNSLAMVFFQMSRKEDDPHTETAFLVMLKASVEEYLYQQLRQKKRLGYDLGCDIHLNPSMRGFYVYVVSSIYQPESLLKDIYTFTGTIGKFWEDVDDSCFESYKKNADNLLPQDSGICHELIHDVSRIEGRMEITKTILETTEKADMLDFCERFFDKEIQISWHGVTNCLFCSETVSGVLSVQLQTVRDSELDTQDKPSSDVSVATASKPRLPSSRV